MVNHRGLVIGFGLRNYVDMIQHNRFRRGFRDQHVRGDHVPRMQIANDVRILERIGHGHRIHEARNCLVIDYDDAMRWIGGNNLAAQMVNLRAGIGRCLRGLPWAGMTTSKSNKRKDANRKKTASHNLQFTTRAECPSFPRWRFASARRITLSWALWQELRSMSGFALEDLSLRPAIARPAHCSLNSTSAAELKISLPGRHPASSTGQVSSALPGKTAPSMAACSSALRRSRWSGPTSSAAKSISRLCLTARAIALRQWLSAPMNSSAFMRPGT